MNFTINFKFNSNCLVELKSVRIYQESVHVNLSINQNILHMQQTAAREQAEEPKSSFDLVFC